MPTGTRIGATTDRPRIVFAGTAISLAIAAAYADGLSGPFLFDDVPSIVRNPSLRRLWPIWPVLNPPHDQSQTVGGRPLLNLSFAVNYAIGGADPVGYHVVNLLIHIAAALTLFGIARRTLLKVEAFREQAMPLAAAISLLWGLHPLQTESVTYLAQRAESLMGLFYLITLYCFIRGTETGGTETGGTEAGWGIVPPGSELRKARTRAKPAAGPLAFDRSRRPEARDELRYEPGGTIPHPASSSRLWLAASGIACLLGMATKEVMVTAPVAVLLYDRTFVAGSFRRALRQWRYYGCLAGTWVLTAWLAIATGSRGGTSGFGLGVSCWDYWLAQGPAIVRYLRLSFWPHPLVVDYGTPWLSGGFGVLAQAALVLVLVAAAAAALRFRPALGFLLCGFFAILAPASLVPGNRQTLAEHRMYLSLAFLATIVVCGVHWALGRLAENAGLARKIAGVLAMAAAAALGLTTALRNEAYRSPLALWTDTVEKWPDNPYAHDNLSAALLQANQPVEALSEAEAALRLRPRYAQGEYNCGLALASLGKIDEAIVHYQRALSLNPDYADAHNNLGNALVKAGRPREAISHYRAAVALDPSQENPQRNLGQALANQGDLSDAAVHYRAALGLSPDDAETRYNLAVTLGELGRTAEAIDEYRAVLRFKPDHPKALSNLGILLAKSGHLSEAIAEFREALRYTPDDATVHANLALALRMAGQRDAALKEAELAQELKRRSNGKPAP